MVPGDGEKEVSELRMVGWVSSLVNLEYCNLVLII